MAEYINKQQLLEKAKKHLNSPFGAALIIAEIEKADFVEVKHGEWIETKEWYFDEYAQSEYQRKCYECSICKRTELDKEPYCHCGAKMDGGKKE